MKREEFLKSLIIKKYNSIRNFANTIDMAPTTVQSILSRGIGNSSVDKVISIAKALNIPVELLEEEEIDISLISNFDSHLIDDTVEIMRRLNTENQNKVLTYAKEREILQDAEK